MQFSSFPVSDFLSFWTDIWELTSVGLLLIVQYYFSCWSLIDFRNGTLAAVITQTETSPEFLNHFACLHCLSAPLLVPIINLQWENN